MLMSVPPQVACRYPRFCLDTHPKTVETGRCRQRNLLIVCILFCRRAVILRAWQQNSVTTCSLTRRVGCCQHLGRELMMVLLNVKRLRYKMSAISVSPSKQPTDFISCDLKKSLQLPRVWIPLRMKWCHRKSRQAIVQIG